MEPVEHCQGFENGIYFNNALMMSPPCHPFIEHIITYLKTTPFIYTGNKFQDVLSSTGPKVLTSLYSKYENKAIINFFPAERVSPWLPEDVRHYVYHEGDIEKLEKKLEKAMAIPNQYIHNIIQHISNTMNTSACCITRKSLK